MGTTEGRVNEFARTLIWIRTSTQGFTCYPDGSRGGQPLTICDYETAVSNRGTIYEEHDVCDITGKGAAVVCREILKNWKT
jgi:ribonucleoside-diphosphate reductase alpha chain